MSIISKWALGYKTRQWKVHENVANADKPLVMPAHLSLDICNSDSPVAMEKPYGDKPRFYPDLEWIAANYDEKNFGGRMGRLAVDWREHKAGVIVMILYDGLPSREAMMRMTGDELSRSCFYTVAIEVI